MLGEILPSKQWTWTITIFTRKYFSIAYAEMKKRGKQHDKPLHEKDFLS